MRRWKGLGLYFVLNELPDGNELEGRNFAPVPSSEPPLIEVSSGLCCSRLLISSSRTASS